jgi:hypothetical protein
MTKGRKEIPPSEQLWGLRKARDRYVALADQLRDDIDLLQRPEEKLARERDARRIAQAYEKSIENMVTSCRVRRIDVQASNSGSVAVKFALAAFLVVIAGGSVLAVTRPAIPRAIMARIIGADTATTTPSVTPDIPAGNTTQMIFPTKEWSAVAPPALSVPGVPLALGRPVASPSPPVHVAKHAPQKESVKAPIKTTDNGERIVVKVLQPDGSLKEQSFPATPRH